MESNEAARDLLRDADRAEAAPWVDFPPTPAWYPPSVGLWAAAMVLALGVLDGVARVAAVVALALVEWAFVAWYRSYRGTLPTGGMPPELRPAAVRLGAGALALVAITIVLVVSGLPVVAAAVVLVLGTVLVWWYERAYLAATRSARARLG